MDRFTPLPRATLPRVGFLLLLLLIPTNRRESLYGGGEHDATENRNVSLFRPKALFLCEFELFRKWKELNWQASSPFNIFTIC